MSKNRHFEEAARLLEKWAEDLKGSWASCASFDETASHWDQASALEEAADRLRSLASDTED